MSNFPVLQSIHDVHIKIIWDYLVIPKVKKKVKQCNFGLVFGCHDVSVAKRTVKIAEDRPSINFVLSGGRGLLTQSLLDRETEASLFKKIIMKKLPEAKTIIEDKSRNSLENVRLSRLILQSSNIGEHTYGVAITKPYSSRRVLALVQKQWQAVDWCVEYSDADLPSYLTNHHQNDQDYKKLIVHFMIGEIYSGTSCLEQHIPDVVWKAYYELERAGFGIDKENLKVKCYFEKKYEKIKSADNLVILKENNSEKVRMHAVPNKEKPSWDHKGFLSVRALNILAKEAGVAWTAPDLMWENIE